MTMRHPSLAEENYGLARRLAAHRHLRRMMARQQVDLAAMQCGDAERVIYRALHTCSHCPAHAACATWLAGTEPASGYVRFCPNSETIEALRIMAV